MVMQFSGSPNTTDDQTVNFERGLYSEEKALGAIGLHCRDLRFTMGLRVLSVLEVSASGGKSRQPYTNSFIRLELRLRYCKYLGVVRFKLRNKRFDVGVGYTTLPKIEASAKNNISVEASIGANGELVEFHLLIHLGLALELPLNL